MRPPFPGMDPWLEHPAIWLDVHNRLITAIADELTPRVAPKYYLSLRQRSYRLEPGELAFECDSNTELGASTASDDKHAESGIEESAVAILDVEIATEDKVEEWYLEFREVKTGVVVTVLEILSHANKIHVRGREGYLWRRGRLFQSWTNLVEIDLLRDGVPMPLRDQAKRSDYRILISRGAASPRATLFAFNIRQQIPTIPIPLLTGDGEPSLDLGAVLHALYDRARFDLRLDYAKPPVPELKNRGGEWAQTVLNSTSPDLRG